MVPLAVADNMPARVRAMRQNADPLGEIEQHRDRRECVIRFGRCCTTIVVQFCNVALGYVDDALFAERRSTTHVSRRRYSRTVESLHFVSTSSLKNRTAKALTVGDAFSLALACAGSLPCATSPSTRFASSRAVVGVQGADCKA